MLISPAIYVYRNQVAQREACRVLLMLFCPFSKRARNASRFGAESCITGPLVMAASGMAHPNGPPLQYNQYPLQTASTSINPQENDEEQQQQQQHHNPSPLLTASRRTSSVATTNSLAESPQLAQRKASEDASAASVVVTVGSCLAGQPPTVATRPISHVVNWRSRSGSVDCRILLQSQQQLPPEQLTCLRKARASISGGCVTTATGGGLLTVEPIESCDDLNEEMEGTGTMRRRSQTISGEMNSSSHHSPEKESEPLRLFVGHASSMGPLTTAPSKVDRRHSHHHHNNVQLSQQQQQQQYLNETGLVNRLNSPVLFPSLDFFDTGLEDYSRRTSAVSFSCAQYIHNQSSATTPTSQAPAGHQRTRRRTCSFSKALGRSTNVSQSHGPVPRWPVGLFTSSPVGNKQIDAAALTTNPTTTSMPSVQHAACLVTAV